MSRPLHNTYVHLGAVLLLAGAARMLLVDPAERTLGQAQAALRTERVRSAQAIAPQLSPESLARLHARNAAMRNTIVGRSAIIKDESTLYATLMDLATLTKVRIDQLQPEAISSSTLTAPPPSPGVPMPKTTPVADAHLAYSMIVVGTYGDIVGFVDAIQSKAGYAIVRSVRLSPTDHREPNAIQAVIQTEYFGFEMKSDQTQSKGGAQ